MAAVEASPTKPVSEIFAFASIVVVSTLVMIALRRHRGLALLRLVGATPSKSARWFAERQR
jgi:ABC-type lipoprotein release transport system permease subunit